MREIRELGYRGGATILKDLLQEIRPAATAPFEVRFETGLGE